MKNSSMNTDLIPKDKENQERGNGTSQSLILDKNMLHNSLPINKELKAEIRRLTPLL